jgi:hypothetical protein
MSYNATDQETLDLLRMELASITRSLEAAQARVTDLTAERHRVGARLRAAMMAREPVQVDDEPTIVKFTKRFGDTQGKSYSYVAIRPANSVRWYITGSDAPQQCSWTALLTYIVKDEIEANGSLQLAIDSIERLSPRGQSVR